MAKDAGKDAETMVACVEGEVFKDNYACTYKIFLNYLH